MAVTVSELFDEYERDFERLCQEADEKVSEDAIASLSSSDRSRQFSEAATQIKSAEKALKQMEFEARTLPTEQRSMVEPKMRRYRQQLGERKKAVEAAKETHSRAVLLGDDAEGGTVYGKSAQDRQRLMDSNDLMQKSTDRLRDARRQAAETEQIGADVMTDLRQQRETIMRTKRNVSEVGSNYGMAKQLLETMSRRAAANRAITIGATFVIGILVCILGASYLGLGSGTGSGRGAVATTFTTTLRSP